MAFLNAASPGKTTFVRTWLNKTQAVNVKFVRVWLNKVSPSPSQSSGATTRPAGGQMQPRNK